MQQPTIIEAQFLCGDCRKWKLMCTRKKGKHSNKNKIKKNKDKGEQEKYWMLNLLDLALSQVLNTASDKRKKDTRKKKRRLRSQVGQLPLGSPVWFKCQTHTHRSLQEFYIILPHEMELSVCGFPRKWVEWLPKIIKGFTSEIKLMRSSAVIVIFNGDGNFCSSSLNISLLCLCRLIKGTNIVAVSSGAYVETIICL